MDLRSRITTRAVHKMDLRSRIVTRVLHKMDLRGRIVTRTFHKMVPAHDHNVTIPQNGPCAMGS